MWNIISTIGSGLAGQAIRMIGSSPLVNGIRTIGGGLIRKGADYLARLIEPQPQESKFPRTLVGPVRAVMQVEDEPRQIQGPRKAIEYVQEASDLKQGRKHALRMKRGPWKRRRNQRGT